MRRIISSLLRTNRIMALSVIFSTILVSSNFASASNIAGSKCTIPGQTKNFSGSNYVCRDKNNKRQWIQIAVASPKNTTVTPSAMPAISQSVNPNDPTNPKNFSECSDTNIDKLPIQKENKGYSIIGLKVIRFNQPFLIVTITSTGDHHNSNERAQLVVHSADGKALVFTGLPFAKIKYQGLIGSYYLKNPIDNTGGIWPANTPLDFYAGLYGELLSNNQIDNAISRNPLSCSQFSIKDDFTSLWG